MINQLYAITDTLLLPGEKLFLGVEAALKGGCQLVQYRDKSTDTRRRTQDAKRLLALCNLYGAKLIINDDLALALEINAHGLHLGQGDGDAKTARLRLGADTILGVTCHDSLELAEAAIGDGATYIAFGRFFSSNTKPDARPAPLGLISEAKQKFPQIDIAAIGGIDLSNAGDVIASGANMLAVCQSLFAADNIETRAQAFTQLLK